jgi:hypothetical protein
MKTNAIRMFLALGAACVCGSVLQAQTYQLAANVPFEFQVGDKAVPEGKYVVSAYGPTGAQAMLSAPNGERYFVSGAYPKLDSTGSARLVFHCYGDACFLAEIWPATGGGRIVSTSKAEKRIRQNGKIEMAMRTVDLIRAD